MLADVLRALEGAELEQVLVAAGDEESAEVAASLGVRWHRDPPHVRSLDDALSSAAELAAPDDTILVVTADLPALSSQDVRAVLAARGTVVIAPTLDGGTGGLLRRPGGVLATCYGPDSAARHRAAAQTAGLATAVLDLAGFRIDVDTGDDLAALQAADRLGQHTNAWLALAQSS